MKLSIKIARFYVIINCCLFTCPYDIYDRWFSRDVWNSVWSYISNGN